MDYVKVACARAEKAKQLMSHLGVFDAICIVVGIVIGSFIFFLGPFLVALNTTSTGMMLLAWVAGKPGRHR